MERDNVLLRRPAITTTVLLTALLIPVAALPYALARRRISHLAKQIDHLTIADANLQSAVSKSAREIALCREQMEHAASVLERSKGEIALLRRGISQTQSQLNSFQSVTDAELQNLLHEEKLMSHRLDLFPGLGLSLADIAAFMHEVELHHALPSSATRNHGIERLRITALKLQIPPTPHKS